GQRLLCGLRAPAAAVRPLRARGSGPRGRRDDDRGLDRDAGGARLAVPEDGGRGRAAPAAPRAGPGRTGGAAGRALRPRAGTHPPALNPESADRALNGRPSRRPRRFVDRAEPAVLLRAARTAWLSHGLRGRGRTRRDDLVLKWDGHVYRAAASAVRM